MDPGPRGKFTMLRRSAVQPPRPDVPHRLSLRAVRALATCAVPI